MAKAGVIGGFEQVACSTHLTEPAVPVTFVPETITMVSVCAKKDG